MSNSYRQMKMNLLGILALTVMPLVFAQSVSRDAPTLPEMSEPVATLDHATGWFKDEVGEWYSNDRAVGTNYFKKIDYSIEDYSRSQLNNFTVIEYRTLMYEGSNLNVLLRYRISGSYRYPSIKQDWETDNTVDFCAIENNDLNEVVQALAAKGTAQRVALNCVYGESVRDTFLTDSTLEKEVIASIVKQQSGSYSLERIETLYIDVFPVEYEGENLVRFHWITLEGFHSIGTFNPSSFDQYYYEVDFDSFAALFNPN